MNKINGEHGWSLKFGVELARSIIVAGFLFDAASRPVISSAWIKLERRHTGLNRK
jgi:hypothetical protein